MMERASRDRKRFDREKAVRLFEQDTVGTLRQVQALRTDARRICKVTGTGAVKCVPIDRLLAFYDRRNVGYIVSDLNLLYRRADLSRSAEVLVRCPGGGWLSYYRRLLDSDEPLEPEEKDEIEDLCQVNQVPYVLAGEIRAGAADPTLGQTFTGITGFDPFGRQCLQLGGDDWLSIVTQQAESFTQACGDVVQETPGSAPPGQSTLMANGNTTTSTTRENGVTCVTTVTVHDDGTKTEVVTCTDSDDTAVTEYDSDGNVTSTTEVSGNTVTTTTQNSDDSETITTENLDTGETTTHEVDADGNVTSTREENSDGDWVETTYDDDGQIESRENSDGDIVDYRDGKPIGFYDPRNGTYTYLDEDGLPKYAIPVGPRGSIDCLDFDDPACQGCQEAGLALKEAMHQCRISGGMSLQCEDYTSVASCCRSEQIPGVDPRLVRPAPDGDLVCVGVAEGDPNQAWCDQMCQLASSAGCVSTCSVAQPISVPVDAVDRFCLYAYSEECFLEDPDDSIDPDRVGSGLDIEDTISEMLSPSEPSDDDDEDPVE